MPSPVEFVLSVARALADHPEKAAARWVDVPEGGAPGDGGEARPKGSHVALEVSPDDRGKIIGRRGRNIQSLRRLVTAVFGKDNRQVGVELAE